MAIRNKTKIYYAILIIFICLILFKMYYDLNNDKVKNAQKKLFVEYKYINIFPGSILIGQNSFRKSNSTIITKKYTINRDKAEISAYYDNELKNHQWEFYKEKKVLDWGRDLGGKEIYYKKNDRYLIIELANKEYNQWNYAITLSWGKTY